MPSMAATGSSKVVLGMPVLMATGLADAEDAEAGPVSQDGAAEPVDADGAEGRLAELHVCVALPSPMATTCTTASTYFCCAC